MIHIPVLRWGEPYQSLENDKVVHFISGEVLAEVGRANAAMVERDMRFAQRARDVLREIPIRDLLQMMKKAGELYAKAELPLGDGTQTPEQLMHPRPLLTKTLSAMMSRYFCQLSTSSSPRMILLKPGPWACTRGFPLYCSTVAVPPKIRLRGQWASTAAPTSPRPG